MNTEGEVESKREGEIDGRYSGAFVFIGHKLCLK